MPEFSSKSMVSIVIPVYNMVGMMDKGIESLLSQTYTNIEYIFVNDGSTDNSLVELQAIQDADSRVSVYTKKNGGLASARNYGMKRAKGQYLYFFDPDDYLDVNLVELCVRKAETTEADLIVFNSVDIDSTSGKVLKYAKHGILPANAGAVAWNKFFVKELWNNLEFPTTVRFEDSAIIPLVVAAANKVELIERDLYYYVKNREGSLLTSSKGSALLDTLETVKYLAKFTQYTELTVAKQSEVFDYISRKLTATFLEYHSAPKDHNQKFLKEWSKFAIGCVRSAQYHGIRFLYCMIVIHLWCHGKSNPLEIIANHRRKR